MQTTELPAVTLHFKEGNSDKVYQANVTEAPDHRFHVTFAFGRRGSTLNTGQKTSEPVDYDEALSIYTKLVKEKKAKGYREGESASQYVTADAQHKTTHLPQLLNPCDEKLADILIHDPNWCAQEKFDGRRLLLVKDEAAIHGLNKKGSLVGLPEPVFQAARLFDGRCVLDGESIGDNFHCFDILQLDGVNIRGWAYRDRLTALLNLLASIQQRAIKYVETAFTTDQKQRMLASLKAGKREGIVFKRLDAPYVSGRPNSGGTQLKHKFTATLSAVVSKLNKQRSVEMRLFGSEGWHVAGNVTIPVNEVTPGVGQVIEVRYLYAFPESGILFQPVYLGKREDVEVMECTVKQLKFKAEQDD